MTPPGGTTTTIMETEPSSRDSKSSDDSSAINFHHVKALVSKWILDFSFTSLCQHFKEDKLNDFDLALKKLEANCEGCMTQKWQIAAFLGRVMHGSQITDVVEEGGGYVMPLMVATSLWRNLRDTVADEEEYNAITTLLHVQSVAVCLKEGRRDLASTALKWLKETQNLPKNMAIKLSTLVAKGDNNHPYMRNFQYQQLLEKLQLYLDHFLAENPSDFLLKAAMTVTQSSRSPDSSGVQDLSSSQSTEDSLPAFKRPKKRLLNVTKQGLWLPQSSKKPLKKSPRLSAQSATAPAPPPKKGRKVSLKSGHPSWTRF
ncbi:telomeric repeat-binding factor 1 isoform X2 [Gadus macrocephalus]|uniref:telomeric repeat-binding factor 1 isoform X2 n=1 Tax=Gadus macrocephalus TaxID=80720 RepID=UPI0028CBA2DE|nr:telomeric repeat-binding factor 1 isoform X2 [Gadus macrocephalus]